MLFFRQFIIVLFYLFLPCQALRCTDNCSYTYNLTKPFDIPDKCNQIVSAGKCIAYLRFSYDTQTYTVTFQAGSSIYMSVADNYRSVWLNFLSTTPSYFSYQISYGCKNKDDCARDLARNAAIEILQKQYNFGGIMNELRPLILTPPLPSNNSVLTCYDSKENVSQCGTLAKRGSCVISHEIEKNAINRLCVSEMIVYEVPVSISQFSNSATFTVHCNRSLCNVNSILQAVKDLMFKYNVTTTLDGRLVESIEGCGSKLMASVLIMIIMSVGLLSDSY